MRRTDAFVGGAGIIVLETLKIKSFQSKSNQNYISEFLSFPVDSV